MYAEELSSTTSSVTIQRTNRHWILGEKPIDFKCLCDHGRQGVRHDTLSSCATCAGLSPCSLSVLSWATCSGDCNSMRLIFSSVVAVYLLYHLRLHTRCIPYLHELRGCPISRTRILCISSSLMSPCSTILPYSIKERLAHRRATLSVCGRSTLTIRASKLMGSRDHET